MPRFVLTESEFLQGIAITKRWTAKRWLFGAVIPTAVYLCMGLYLIYSPDTADLKPIGVGIILLVPFGWLFGALANKYYVPYRARKLYKERKHRACEVSWDARGVTLTTEYGHGLTPWSDFSRWRQNDDVILLSLSRQLYVNVPKSAFTSEELADFLKLIRAHISPEPDGAPKAGPVAPR